MDTKILIVDDDDSVRRFLERTLSERGYSISEADSASSARERMRSEMFDLVLCDVRMPGESGMDLVRFMRTDHPEAAVIMISALADPESVETALGLGVYGYLTKPFGPNEVLIGVASALRRRALEIENRSHREGLETAVFGRTQDLQRAIDQLKWTERALRASESRYRELFANMSSGVVVFEAKDEGNDFIIADSNRAAERIEGIRRDDAIGGSIVDVLPAVMRFGLIEVFQRVWRTGKPEHQPASLHDDDRGSGWRESYVYKLPTGEVVWVCDDITRRKQAELALRESEERNRSLRQAIPDLMFVLDKNGTFLDHHAPSTTDLYRSPQEFLGRSIVDVMPPPVGERSLACTEQVLKFGEAETLEYEIPIGEILRSFEARFVPCGRDKTLAIVRDITTRKRAELELKESERRLKAIFDCAADGILVVDAGHKGLCSANRAFCRMTGYSPAEITKLRVTDIHPKENRPYILEQFEKHVKGEITFARSLPVRRKDGRVFYADVNSTPVTIDGRLCLMGIFRDVTERTDAELALKEAERRFRTLLDNVGLLAVGLDREAKVAYANPCFQRATGYTIGEALGSDWFETFIPERDRATVAVVFKEILEEGAWPRYENLILTKGGEERRIVWYNTPLLAPSGDAVGTMSIGDDVTERRRAEEDLRETMRGLEDFNRIAVGRELKMIELKEEVNQLRSELGTEPKYETEDQPVEQGERP